MGYIGIVQHKEHSPEVLSIPPGTPCIQRLVSSLFISEHGGRAVDRLREECNIMRIKKICALSWYLVNISYHNARSEERKHLVLLYAFFWVIPRRLNFIYQCFGTLCLSCLHRRVGMKNSSCLPTYEDRTDRVFRNVGI